MRTTSPHMSAPGTEDSRSVSPLRRHWLLICAIAAAVTVLMVAGAGLLHRPATEFPSSTIATKFDYADIALNDDPTQRFTDISGTVPQLSDLPQTTFDEAFPKNQTLPYPEGMYFTPLRLAANGTLIGETRYGTSRLDTQPGKLALGAYDLTTGAFSTFAERNDADSHESYAVPAANTEHVLFESSTMSTSSYALADLSTSKHRTLLTSERMPTHLTGAAFDGNGVMLNRFDPDVNQYVLEYHGFDGSVTLVERNNCSKAINVGSLWYYVLLDREAHTSSLVALDASARTKTVVYQIDSELQYLGQPEAAGDSLFVAQYALTAQDDGGNASVREVRLLRVDTTERTVMTLLSTDSMEPTLQANERFVVWSGASIVSNRTRLQTIMLDTATMTVLSQDNGGVFLADDTLAWVRYRKSDADINKGEVYTDANTEIKVASTINAATITGRTPATAPSQATPEQPTEPSTATPSTTESATAPTTTGDTVRLNVPTTLQEQGDWCVPAALQSVLTYKGIASDQATLAAAMNTQPVTGTEYVDLARVANAYLFGVESANPAGAGYHVQTIAIGDTSNETARTFAERVKADMATDDPVFAAVDVAALYPGFAHGNHIVVITGYNTDGNGNITHYRYVDSMRGVQDPTYAGLKIVTAETMMHAIVTNEEPAYVW
ncbi:C39 family peptidase [Bifidobacterium oedipodis]|uniref:Peptidase C39 n=1 Tax=Bifidobacterium oedipodis TaxID=2675322 RepID=A0A7Y0ERQ0_9BIFI|nr:C39 family peptidase [Bifidobacterium sp. DSM 109957]NMM95198.1 peptidase C39 [Bifidobacterium sp. DSM 109957]